MESVATKLLSDLGCEHAELSILLTNDGEIRTLNEAFRKKPKATDVLSFPMAGGDRVSSSLLGDVVISVERAMVQAKERGISVEEELLRLLIHGILHLVGYDHENVSTLEAQKMFAKEEELLGRYGGA